jgi:peptidase E
MKLFLFGGAPAHDGHANVETLLKLIEATIRTTWVRQIFHIPYARTIATEPERAGDWFHRHIHLDGVEYLNANNPDDIAKVDKALILISGGGKTFHLLQKLQENPALQTLIKNADFVIGESGGAKVLCSAVRVTEMEGNIVQWLWIIEHCMIEPHYIEKSRQSMLDDDMKEPDIQYGIGIDSDTGIEIDLTTFPKYTKIGDGVVEMKINPTK